MGPLRGGHLPGGSALSGSGNPAYVSATVSLDLGDLIKVARAGLMATQLWLYLLPVVLAGVVPGVAYWIGAVYVTVPLGVLIYGWNDIRDADVDALSPRKHGSRMARFFGERLVEQKRRQLPAVIVALQLPFVLLAAAADAVALVLWLPVMLVANALYHEPSVRLSRLPVLAELSSLWIYLNIAWLSLLISGVGLPWPGWMLAAAAVLVFQVAGAVVDLEADREAGKLTLAAALGEQRAGLLLAAILAVKAAALGIGLGSPPAALLTLAAMPLCFSRPRLLGRYRWSSFVYLYSVVVDWLCLALLLPARSCS